MDFYNWLISLNFKTFRNKILIAYLVLAMVLSGLLLGSWWFLYQNAVKPYGQALEMIAPIRYYCAQLENTTQQSSNALHNYLLTKKEFYKEERQRSWDTKYRSAIDSLMSYSLAWKDDKVIALVYDVRIKAGRLRAEQDQLETAHITQTRTLDALQSLQLLHNDIQTVLSLIQNIQKEELSHMRTSVDFEYQNLTWFYAPITLILLFVACLVVGAIILNRLFERINYVRQSLESIDKGVFPAPIPEPEDEFLPIVKALNMIIVDLRYLKRFAQEVGQGDFEAQLPTFDPKGEFGTAFLQMRDSLKQISIKEQERNWSNEGIAHFSKVLREQDYNLGVLCETFTQQLIAYLKTKLGGQARLINQIGLYIAENKKLELISCYAYQVKKFEQKQIDIGEGIVGQAFQEKRTVYLTNLPADYVHISSGLGEATPRCLLVVPLQVGNSVEGMIEIASFHTLEAYQIDFVEKICETMASMIVSVKAKNHTKKLLLEAQRQSERLQVQDEELRQNVEEMEAAQELMKKKEQKITQMLTEAQENERMLQRHLEDLENAKEQLEAKNKEIEQIKEDERKRADMKIQAQKVLMNRLLKRNKELEALTKNGNASKH